MLKASLLLGLLCAHLPLLADPPSEDVLRPVVPSSARYYLEPHIGLNLTQMSADPVVRAQIPGEGDLDIYRSASGIAPFVGLTVGYQINRIGGIELDLSYDGRRASNSGSTLDGCEVIDTVAGGSTIVLRPTDKEYTVGVDYFTIALSGTLTFDQFFLHAGPSISVALGSTFTETMRWSGEDPECRYFYQTVDESLEIVGTPDTLESAVKVAFRLGAGVIISIADGVEMIPRVSYDLMLSDAFTHSGGYTLRREGTVSPNVLTSEYSGAITLSALQASLGIRILL